MATKEQIHNLMLESLQDIGDDPNISSATRIDTVLTNDGLRTSYQMAINIQIPPQIWPPDWPSKSVDELIEILDLGDLDE